MPVWIWILLGAAALALLGVFIVAGLVAVSYTHLDVYKRQRRGCATGAQALAGMG